MTGSSHRKTSARGRSDRGSYLIKNGAVLTVDPVIGTLAEGDVLVRSGVIEQVGAGLAAGDAETVDATGMIVMPGFVDAHNHMWSSLGKNFIADNGFEYVPAKHATSHLYEPEDFYNSVTLGLTELTNAGVTTVHNWAHNNRSPAHVDAELRAHLESRLRARYSLGHIDRLAVDEVNTFDDLDRVRAEWFGSQSPFDGLVHLGLNIRGTLQSDESVFHREMESILPLGLPIAVHASQMAPNIVDAPDLERRGYLGPNFLISHYIPARPEDRAAMARTGTPLTFSTQSELRLGETGDPRATLLKMIADGVLVSLSLDASSLAPFNMFEIMRLTWYLGIPWRGTDTEALKPIAFTDVIEMSTINGARALGLGDLTGSLTPGKRADIILIRTDDLNSAPLANIATTVVQSANTNNVDTVMVDGRILKRGGQLVDIDVERIVQRAKESAFRIRKAAGGLLTPHAAALAAASA